MICVVYVDDTIICAPGGDEIEAHIHDLGVSKDEKRCKLELIDKGKVGDFLGILIEKEGPSRFHLKKNGLIDKDLKVSGIENYKKAKTPASTTHF